MYIIFTILWLLDKKEAKKLEKSKEELRKEKALQKLERPWFKKKRWWFLVLIFLFVITVIGSCGALFNAVDNELQKGSVGTEKSVSNGADSNTNDNEEKVEKKNIVVIDSADAKVVITGFVTYKDAIFGETAKLLVEITNKSDQAISVHADHISVDGLMADDLSFLAETVAANKTAKANISFDEWLVEKGKEMPKFEDAIEGKITIFDEQTYNTLIEKPFNVKLK